MSYIRLPSKVDGKLPSVPSEDEDLAPIEVTMWKCRRQVAGTLIVCLGIFGMGSIFGWAAVAVPALKRDEKIDSNNSSIEALISSIFIIGAMFAGPFAGYLMFKLGRKIATFLFAVLFTIGWVPICAAEWITNQVVCESMLCGGRFLTGFAGAGCLVIGPIYVREICDEAISTAMGSLVPLILVLGYTFCFAFGFILPWWILTIACTIPSLLLCFLIFWIPNTPRHLLITKNEGEARKAMNWLTYGFTPEEQERIFKKVKRGVEMLDRDNNRAMKRIERKQVEKRLQLRLTSRSVSRPLIVSIVMVFLQQGSGSNVLGTYTTDILELGQPGADIGTLVIGIVYFLAVVLVTLIVERWGRKPLLLVGSVMMCVSQVILGVYCYYVKNRDNDFSWIPFTCCNVFFASYALGLGSITWILATEINHPDFQEIAGTLDSFTYWTTAFISMMTFPSLRSIIDYHWCFWFYAMMNFIAIWFSFFCVYETKGKSQEEIMAHYRGVVLDPENEDAESKSLGSIHYNKITRGSNRRRPSGDSTASDWETDLETIFETESEDT